MIRTFHSFPVKDMATTKQQMLSWANRFSICCFMDNHGYDSAHHLVECLLGVGVLTSYELQDDFVGSLDRFYSANQDWIFGHFNYDLKNKFEQLSSGNPDYIGFADTFLFVPEVVIRLENNWMHIGVVYDDAIKILGEILSVVDDCETVENSIEVKARINSENYIATINALLNHIKKGDCYEINFCQEFYGEGANIDPLQLYKKLTAISPNPFSTYYRLDDKFLLCASPERYLQKQGSKVISQPIKGTWPRGTLNEQTDWDNRNQFSKSVKDRTENVMIVDLVRNDLSKICMKGTVQVDELFGIYSFPQIYQMISTISGTLTPGLGLGSILSATFPMGSMTGAPKKKVMELIEKYETTRRGIFSGTVGYITPDKNFDFNVVIRSILYNKSSKYLSYLVGGGITSNSIPEKEYQECLLKAAAINKVLSGDLGNSPLYQAK